jgi:hypothetical protein
MSKGFIINCDEATAICNKNQYNEASLWEKVKLSVHFFICKKCGMYSKQNTIITDACNKHLHKCEAEHKLTEKEKKELQVKVTEKIK